MIVRFILLLFTVAAATLSEAEDVFPETPRNADGYSLAVPGVALVFPRDHGSHPDFKTEWWYITGHLKSSNDEYELGFQVTFFRSADKDTPASDPTQIYMAHAAITNKRTGEFLHEERLNTEDWNAEAATGRLNLFNGNWYLRMTDSNTESMETRFSLNDFGILNLSLTPEKPKTLFGDNGYSKKGDRKGDASYYVTFTRLRVEGSITKGGKSHTVAGQAWMDHEFSSSQLGDAQIGWNWTSLILDDDTELMAYVMRRSDDAVDPNSRLTLIGADGSKREFSGNGFSWTPLRFWESQQSGARYPVAYEISWNEDGKPRTVRVEPFTDAQELNGAIGDFTYWEGASRALDESGKQIGLGYTELTGYDESLNGKF